MIVNMMEMKKCAQDSGLSENQLIELTGQKIAEALLLDTTENQRILFVCGKGNKERLYQSCLGIVRHKLLL